MAESIRDIIKAKSAELRDVSQLGPQKASEELIILTSLLSNLNEYLSDRHYWLNVLRAKKLEEVGVVSRAKMATDASPEYKEWHEATFQKEALIELIRSLKVYIKNASEELREFSKN